MSQLIQYEVQRYHTFSLLYCAVYTSCTCVCTSDVQYILAVLVVCTSDVQYILAVLVSVHLMCSIY